MLFLLSQFSSPQALDNGRIHLYKIGNCWHIVRWHNYGQSINLFQACALLQSVKLQYYAYTGSGKQYFQPDARGCLMLSIRLNRESEGEYECKYSHIILYKKHLYTVVSKPVLFAGGEGWTHIYIYIYPDVFFFSSSCTECVGMLTVVPVAHICIYSELWIWTCDTIKLSKRLMKNKVIFWY